MANGKRLIALDVLRGLTIAGMIVVNNPGSWSYVYAPLDIRTEGRVAVVCGVERLHTDRPGIPFLRLCDGSGYESLL